MAFVKFPTPPRNFSHSVSIEPIIRLQYNKGGRKLILTQPVLLATGFVKGDRLVIGHDDQTPSLCEIRRGADGEDVHGLLSQSKGEKNGSFTAGGTVLVNAGYGPGESKAQECGMGYVKFDVAGFPPISDFQEPVEAKIKPWPLSVSPKVTMMVVRALVERMAERSISREYLVNPAEIAAIKKFVTQKKIDMLRTRSKPGQGLWFEETETTWAQRFR